MTRRRSRAVVNWFTSFGYFDAATNDSVLAGFARALRPGGLLLVDMQNPDRIARLAAPAHGTFASVTERDGEPLGPQSARMIALARRSA